MNDDEPGGDSAKPNGESGAASCPQQCSALPDDNHDIMIVEGPKDDDIMVIEGPKDDDIMVIEGPYRATPRRRPQSSISSGSGERMVMSSVRVKISKTRNPLECDGTPTSSMFMPRPGRLSARRTSAIDASPISHQEFLAEQNRLMDERRLRIYNEIQRRSEKRMKREMKRQRKVGEGAARIMEMEKRRHTDLDKSEKRGKRMKENAEKAQEHIVTPKSRRKVEVIDLEDEIKEGSQSPQMSPTSALVPPVELVHLDPESPSSEVAVVNPTLSTQTESEDVFCDLLLGDLQDTNFEDPNAVDELAKELLRKTKTAHRLE